MSDYPGNSTPQKSIWGFDCDFTNYNFKKNASLLKKAYLATGVKFNGFCWKPLKEIK